MVRLDLKLWALGLNSSLCWILDFLSGRDSRSGMVFRIVSNTSSPPSQQWNTAGLFYQPCSVLLIQLLLCFIKKLLTFADDTMLIGLITDNLEKAYREEVHIRVPGKPLH